MWPSRRHTGNSACACAKDTRAHGRRAPRRGRALAYRPPPGGTWNRRGLPSVTARGRCGNTECTSAWPHLRSAQPPGDGHREAVPPPAREPHCQMARRRPAWAEAWPRTGRDGVENGWGRWRLPCAPRPTELRAPPHRWRLPRGTPRRPPGWPRCSGCSTIGCGTRHCFVHPLFGTHACAGMCWRQSLRATIRKHRH